MIGRVDSPPERETSIPECFWESCQGNPVLFEGQGLTSQGRGPEQNNEVSRTSLQGFGQLKNPDVDS
jgi:hypothetical protein